MADNADESQEEEQKESATVSFSQGCVYSPEKVSVQSRFLQDSATFAPLRGETKEDSQRRYCAYTNTWTHIKQCMDELLSQQHDALLQQVVQFVETAKKQWISAASSHQSTALLPFHLTMIPTASIIAGMSFSDHEVLYDRLCTRLDTEVTPYIVMLGSHDCSSGMGSLVKEVHKQLIQDWIPDRSISQHKRVPGLTISTLLSWHLRKLQISETSPVETGVASKASEGNDDNSANKKARMKEPNHRPIVFVIKDFDAFPSPLLEDLIVSLKPLLPCQSLVLILGLATSPTSLHHSLTQSAMSALHIEHFRVQPSVSLLNTVVDKVLMNSALQFRLKDKALNYLLHHFLYLNFSITELQKGLQFAVMEHFIWQPLSFLCDGGSSVTEMVSSMSCAQFEMARSVPSFQKYIESLDDPVKQLDLLKDDLKLQPLIVKFLTDMIEHHKSTPVLLHCLYILTHSLPGAPLGCQMYEFYYQSLLGDITDSVDFQSAWKFVKVMAKLELEESVTKCVKLLKKCSCPQLVETAKILESYVHELAQLSDHAKIPVSKAARKKKQPNEFEKTRAKILDYLLETIRKYLRYIDSFPLHELFYFNQASWLKKHLNPVISNVIHKALSNPGLYIPSAGSVSEDTGIDPNMPDVCIVYQLYLEFGKLINIQDWRKAFISIVSAEKDVNDNVLYEQFHSAMSQLQFMGFVRPAKRKKDHMQRLTWYH